MISSRKISLCRINNLTIGEEISQLLFFFSEVAFKRNKQFSERFHEKKSAWKPFQGQYFGNVNSQSQETLKCPMYHKLLP